MKETIRHVEVQIVEMLLFNLVFTIFPSFLLKEKVSFITKLRPFPTQVHFLHLFRLAVSSWIIYAVLCLFWFQSFFLHLVIFFNTRAMIILIAWYLWQCFRAFKTLGWTLIKYIWKTEYIDWQRLILCQLQLLKLWL